MSIACGLAAIAALHRFAILSAMRSTNPQPPSVDRIVSCLKRFGADSIEGGRGVSGINVDPAARALVNDIERYPHAFVLACVADRQTKADIAWSLPHLVREAAEGFDIDTLLRLPGETWTSVLASSGHRLATQVEQLLPAAIRHIGDRYGGDASRIWADGSSGAAVARRFLAFDGVGPKIANMAVNILIRDFGIRLTRPMPDIAVDTHVLRVFERLGLLGRLEHSLLRSTKDKQALRLQLRAREVNPEWPGELDWPAWMVGKTWCHAGRAPECYRCAMRSVCPRDGVAPRAQQPDREPERDCAVGLWLACVTNRSDGKDSTLGPAWTWTIGRRAGRGRTQSSRDDSR